MQEKFSCARITGHTAVGHILDTGSGHFIHIPDQVLQKRQISIAASPRLFSISAAAKALQTSLYVIKNLRIKRTCAKNSTIYYNRFFARRKGDFANFAKKIFEGQYDVGTAKNGQEAIDIIEANKDNENIVAILLDLNMPKVDGFEVLKYMEDNDLFEKTPVSIITGDSSKETIDKAYKYPIIDMLGKPFTENDVKRIVEKTLSYKDLA